jgi:hypothetical protein
MPLRKSNGCDSCGKEYKKEAKNKKAKNQVEWR